MTCQALHLMALYLMGPPAVSGWRRLRLMGQQHDTVEGRTANQHADVSRAHGYLCQGAVSRT